MYATIRLNNASWMKSLSICMMMPWEMASTKYRVKKNYNLSGIIWKMKELFVRWNCWKGWEKEVHRQAGSRTKRQMDGQIERQTDRWRQMGTWKDRQIDGRTDRQMERQTDGHMERQTDKWKDRWTDRKMDGQMERQTDRQTDWLTKIKTTFFLCMSSKTTPVLVVSYSIHLL